MPATEILYLKARRKWITFDFEIKLKVFCWAKVFSESEANEGQEWSSHGKKKSEQRLGKMRLTNASAKCVWWKFACLPVGRHDARQKQDKVKDTYCKTSESVSKIQAAVLLKNNVAPNSKLVLPVTSATRTLYQWLVSFTNPLAEAGKLSNQW